MSDPTVTQPITKAPCDPTQKRKRTPAPALTAATVKAALRDADAGEHYIRVDGLLPGLELKVKPSGAAWTVRTRLHQVQRRYEIGKVLAGDEDRPVGFCCLRTARERATWVKAQCRKNFRPDAQIREWMTGVPMHRQREVEAAKPAPSWEWEDSKARYLASLLEANRQDTHRDYRGKLKAPELERFKGRKVNTITRNEILQACDAVAARDVQPMAEGVLRVVKAMWTWLADGVRQDQTSVIPNLLLRAKLQKRRLREIGDPRFIDDDEEKGKAPPEIELGRVLAITQMDVLPSAISYGLQLVLASLQRNRAVRGANTWRFRSYAEAPDEEVWFVPPFFRKSGSARGNKSHLVPILSWGAEAVRKLDRLSDDEGWLFPAGRPQRAGKPNVNPFVGPKFFNTYLQAMPGVSWSPHDVRYAFSDYGERDLGFAKSEARLILDHMEATEPDDVTGQFYTSNPAIARKREMMRLWLAWLDHWCAKATAADPLLSNRDALVEAIFRGRYDEERVQKRIAWRSRRDRPLWNDLKKVRDDDDE